MRPGPPPPPRPPRRTLGPTPRYRSIPRWGLVDRIDWPTAGDRSVAGGGASVHATGVTLLFGAIVFAVAASVFALRYLLMLINRTTLLSPLIAVPMTVASSLVSVIAIATVCVVAVVSTSWLIRRRAEVFARRGHPDPRRPLELWLGYLIPVVNFVMAPYFLVELAQAQGCRARQDRRILLWMLGWITASVICVGATWSGRRAHDSQAIADNTVVMVIAYLAGLAAVLLLRWVIGGFVGIAAETGTGRRPRWVILPAGAAESPGESAPESPGDVAVESGDRQPAA